MAWLMAKIAKDTMPRTGSAMKSRVMVVISMVLSLRDYTDAKDGQLDYLVLIAPNHIGNSAIQPDTS